MYDYHSRIYEMPKIWNLKFILLFITYNLEKISEILSHKYYFSLI